MLANVFYARLFASLAADKSPVVPYNKELAEQRKKYGDGVLRRCDEQLAIQRQHEAGAKAKLDAARQKRQEEKDRQDALEVRFDVLLEHLHCESRILTSITQILAGTPRISSGTSGETR